MSYTNFWVAELCRVELATTGHVTRFNKSEWIISAYPTRYTTFKFVYDIGSSFSTSTEQGKSWLLQMNFHMISLLTFAIPGLFFLIFVFSIQLIVNVQYNFLPMTGFEPRTSGIGSDYSTNWEPLPNTQKHSYLKLPPSFPLFYFKSNLKPIKPNSD